MANKQIVVRRDNSGLSEILFTLKVYTSAKGKSAYEIYTHDNFSSRGKKSTKRHFQARCRQQRQQAMLAARRQTLQMMERPTSNKMKTTSDSDE